MEKYKIKVEKAQEQLQKNPTDTKSQKHLNKVQEAMQNYRTKLEQFNDKKMVAEYRKSFPYPLPSKYISQRKLEAKDLRAEWDDNTLFPVEKYKDYIDVFNNELYNNKNLSQVDRREMNNIINEAKRHLKNFLLPSDYPLTTHHQARLRDADERFYDNIISTRQVIDSKGNEHDLTDDDIKQVREIKKKLKDKQYTTSEWNAYINKMFL